MVEFLCEYVARSGSEIALHGCSHQTNRLSRPSRNEFFEFEGLSLDEQEELIAQGTEVLVESIGIKPCTFIPPWNRLDRNTLYACLKHGYKNVSSGPYTPVIGGIQSLGMNCTLATFSSLFEKTRTTDHRVLLIINYHSPRIRTQQDLELLEDAVELAASSDSEVLTLSETVQRYPELVQRSNEAAMNIVPQWQILHSDRARSAIYERVLRRAGVRNGLTEAYTSDRNLYWQGRYEEAGRLSHLIDRLCKRLLRFGRFTSVAGGVIVGVLVWALLTRYRFSNRIYWYVGILILIAMFGAVSYWHLTNKDAKREIWIVTLLITIAAVCAVGIGEAVSLVY
jgi:hypothetical protein